MRLLSASHLLAARELVQIPLIWSRLNRFRALMFGVRKLIAIALLVVFGLPLASSLLALSPTSEANLPACCRKNGKHHCMMSLAEQRRQQGDKPGVAAPAEKCPYCPTALLNIHSQIDFMPQAGQAIYAGLVSHPAVIAQTECKLRIARDKSRGKRGPPPSSI